MNIVVCVKQVPDTLGREELDPADNTLDRESADAVMNELDEYAVEEALRIKESLDGAGEVTVLTMGPDKAAETIRKALSMGADRAIHVVDDALHGSDARRHVRRARQGARHDRVDLVILGSESTDARTSVVPGDARRAPGPAAADLREQGRGRRARTVRIQRQTDYGYDTVEGRPPRRRQRRREDQRAALPVVQGDHGGEEEAGDDALARRPRLDAGDGRPRRCVDHGRGLRASVRRAAPDTIVNDEGDGGTKLAEFLAHRSSSDQRAPFEAQRHHGRDPRPRRPRRRRRQEGHDRAAHARPPAR